MKLLTKEEADTWLRGKEHLRDGLKRLPDDVDPELAAKKVLSQLGDGYNAAWSLGRSCQRLPAPVIREVVVRLANEKPSPERVFLRELVRPDAEDLQGAWAEALQVLLDLNLTYAWGSKQRKAKLQALAKKPRVVNAIQAAVVGNAEVPLDMLAVLAIDSSDASIDALLPKFAEGKNQTGLEKLATHAAKSPAMAALLAGATRKREEKERTSSAVEAVGLIVGDAQLERVKFSIAFSSEESETGNVPVIQAHLSVNSAHDTWWAVSVSRVDRSMKMPSTWFSTDDAREDGLGLGRCSFEGIPKWVAQAAKKLKVTFRVAYFSGSLRGKKRDAVTTWLLSAI